MKGAFFIMNLQDLCVNYGYDSNLLGFKELFLTNKTKFKEIHFEVSMDSILLLRCTEKNISCCLEKYGSVEYLTFYRGKSKTHIVNVPCNEIKECVSKKFSDTIIEYVFNFKNVTYKILASV